MKNFVILLFCIITVFFQLSVMGVFFPAHQIPDLTLALAVSLVLILGFEDSLKWLLFAGILMDTGSGSVFGIITLSYLLIAVGVSQLAIIADIRSRKIFFLIVFAAYVSLSEIAKDLLMSAGQNLRAYHMKETLVSHSIIFNSDYILKIVYTIVAAYCIYYIFRRASRKLFFEPAKLSKARL